MSLSLLHQKISDFEAAQSSSLKQLSHCQKGCSRCCYVDLSVFEVEADYVRRWFRSLPAEEKQKLRTLWLAPLKEQLNFQGEMVKACSFLREEACTIYAARPVICRTQGLPLTFKQDDHALLDICPLNSEMLAAAKHPEILNLETLNLILAQLETQESKGKSRPRILLSSLIAELSEVE